MNKRDLKIIIKINKMSKNKNKKYNRIREIPISPSLLSQDIYKLRFKAVAKIPNPILHTNLID